MDIAGLGKSPNADVLVGDLFLKEQVEPFMKLGEDKYT